MGGGRNLCAQRGRRRRRVSHTPTSSVRLFQPQLSRADSPLVKKAGSSWLPAFPSGDFASFTGFDPRRDLGGRKDRVGPYRKISSFKVATFQGFNMRDLETVKHETLY